MENNIVALIDAICQQKKLQKEKVLEALEQALAAAYRKDFGQKNQNIKAKFNPENGKLEVYDIKTVVEDLPPEAVVGEEEPAPKTAEPATEATPEKKFNPKTDLQISEATELYPKKKNIKIGDEIVNQLETPTNFGRIAAQTAKQVILQKLKEMEREAVYLKYKDMEKQIIEGTIQKRNGLNILVNLEENVIAILPSLEQIPEEQYLPNQRYKFHILSVNPTVREPEIILSRRSPEMVDYLFRSEIPEVGAKTVEIKKIVRAAGVRSKVAVISKDKKIDPVGACIGQRGIRIQTIAAALNNERIDVIEYTDDAKKFILNALTPAKITSLEINEQDKTAKAVLKKDQMSLAIGKRGMNLHLASEITGYKIFLDPEEVEETPAIPNLTNQEELSAPETLPELTKGETANQDILPQAAPAPAEETSEKKVNE
jgi:N utilization substance protein A